MRYSDMGKSIEIFKKYGLDDEFFESDHDVIFGPNLDTPFSEEDRSLLNELGWRESDEYDCWAS